jgi:hypothetical protein
MNFNAPALTKHLHTFTKCIRYKIRVPMMTGLKLTVDSSDTSLNGPAYPWPGGSTVSWKPDVHSPLQAKAFYTCVSLCAGISGALVILRMYTKIRIVRKLDLSDCEIHLQAFSTLNLTRRRYDSTQLCG